MFMDPGNGGIGLPQDQQPSYPPPGFEGSASTIQPPPPISTLGALWETIKEAPSHLKEDIKAGYELARDATGTVLNDVANPIEKAATGVYWYAIVGLVVIGGIIYFAGKSGAFKMSVSR